MPGPRPHRYDVPYFPPRLKYLSPSRLKTVHAEYCCPIEMALTYIPVMDATPQDSGGGSTVFKHHHPTQASVAALPFESYHLSCEEEGIGF